MSDTILVDGVDFESEFRHIRFTGWGDMHTVSAPRGSNYEVPGRSGEVWRRKVRTATIHSLGWSITPDGLDESELMARANSEWFKLLKLFPRRRLVEVTRVIGLVNDQGGIDQVRQVAYMERIDTLAPNWVAHSYQDGFLTLKNVYGAWFDETYSTFDVSAGSSSFIPVSGTSDSATVVVELVASVAGLQTLTNVSAGVSFSYVWTPDRVGTTLQVDAGAFTVRRFTSPTTWVRSMTTFTHAGDDRFMIVDPDLGDNEFTLNQGSATVAYRGLWL